MDIPLVVLRLDARLLAGHQRVADVVHARTGHPCYDLALASNVVALMGWVMLLLLYVPAGVLMGRGAGPFLDAVVCVAALAAAVGMLHVARRTASRLRGMRRAWLNSWICGGLPVTPRPGATADTPGLRLLQLGIAVFMAVMCGFEMHGTPFDVVSALGITGTILMGIGVPATTYFESCRPRPPGASRRGANRSAAPEGVSARA